MNPDTLTLSHFKNYLIELYGNLQSWESIYQILAIVLAAVLAYFVTKRLGRLFTGGEQSSGKSVKAWLDNFWFEAGRGIVFSFLAACFILLFILILQTTGILPEGKKTVIGDVAYQILFSWTVFSLLLQFLRISLGKKIAGKTFVRFFSTLFWILAFLRIVGLLAFVIKTMKETVLPIGSGSATLWTLAMGAITLLIMLCIANWFAMFCDKALKASKELSDNSKVVISRILKVGIYFLAVLMALSFVGIDLTVLSVFGGAIGVGVGFGLQKIASNYISGFIILFDRSIKIGDYIEVNGFTGNVTEINTRYTVIKNLAGDEMIVPNETFISTSVKNHSYSSNAKQTTIDVSIGYTSNLNRAMEILKEAVDRQPRLVPGTQASVTFNEMGDDGIDLRAWFWVTDPQLGTAGMKSEIYKEVLRRYDEENIEIPYHKLDVNIISGGKAEKNT